MELISGDRPKPINSKLRHYKPEPDIDGIS